MKAKCSTARGNHGSRVNWRRRRLTATFCALTVPLLALTGCAHGKQQDARLRRVVARRLAADRGLDGANVNVAAANGVVTLSGVTNTNAQRSAAAADANIVGAVTQVVNRIESLEALQAALQAKLAADPAFKGTSIVVTVGPEAATLTGQVGSREQKSTAENMARQILAAVPGVKVEDQIAVVAAPTPPRPARLRRLRAAKPSPPPTVRRPVRRAAVRAPAPVRPAGGAIVGEWQAYFQGFSGPLVVNIRQAGDRVSGIVVGGSHKLTAYIPAGKMMFYGSFGARGFPAKEICAGLHYTSPHWINATFKVIDADHMEEGLPWTGPYAQCSGFPVLWERLRGSHDAPPQQSSAPAASPEAEVLTANTPAPPAQGPPAPPAPQRLVTLPAGTVLEVRLNQGLASNTSKSGQTFSGALAAPVAVGGQIAVPADALVTGVILYAHSAGHFKGRSELRLALSALRYNGDRYPLATNAWDRKSAARGGSTAKKVGIGAVAGGILGGIFGGAKGAIAGAGAGAGGGAAVQALTKPPEVALPTEAVIRLKLAAPIEVRPAGAFLRP